MHTSHCHSDYDEFRKRHKKLIRPDDIIKLMSSALHVNAEFFAEYEALRRFIRPILANWGEALIAYFKNQKELADRFSLSEEAQLKRLIKLHSQRLALGRFDSDYLDSLEDIALFFIFHDVKSVWVAGAYQHMTRNAIDSVFQHATDKKAIRVRQMMKTLVSALAIELNQIQRVYMFYERRQTEIFIEDLKSGEFLIKPLETHIDVEAPTLEPEHVALVQQSYSTVVAQSELFVKAFDRRLADLATPTHALLQRSLAASETNLQDLLQRLVQQLSQPESLAPDLAAVGRHLAEFDVEPRECDEVLEIFFETLQRALGQAWDDQTEAAWRSVCSALMATTFTTSATVDAVAPASIDVQAVH